MSSKRVAFQDVGSVSADSDADDDDDGFVGVGDGSRPRGAAANGRRQARRRPHLDDDDLNDDANSDSDQEIDRRARDKKRSQFERGIGNQAVEGEQLETSAPDGFEPFHMKEERAQGWFDSAGNFNLESEDIREAWLRDYDEKQVDLEDSFIPDQPVDLSRQGIKRYRPDQKTPDDEYEDIVDQTRERQIVLQHLNRGETVLDALRRLGKDDDKTAFTALTESADRLLQSGHYDVYQDTIISIERALSSSSGTGSRSAQPRGGPSTSSASGSTNQWELRWSNNGTDPEPIHGPYSSDQMEEWKGQGYFDPVDNRPNCYVRVRGAPDPEWTVAREIDSFIHY